MGYGTGIRTISLFSGAGGLDIGFEKAGFNILFANDNVSDCCETLMMNRGITISEECEVLCEDITRMDLSVLPQNIDMIIGGPPCQSFSASGRRAGGAAGQLDQRGNLFKSYCKVVEYVRPKVFLFENVRGILATNKGRDFQNIVSEFSALGYHLDYRILDAEDYGVPQQRERMFIVGHLDEKEFKFPRPVYGPDSKEGIPHITVKNAIEDLPFTALDKQETKFEGGRYSHLLPLVPPGSNYLFFTAKRGYPEPIFAYRSRFSDFLYKADPNHPVKTLIASPGKYTGPLHWDNRYLTVAEYKRIQGFPDEHLFYGDRISQIRQIGNSVCPKIAYYMALAIREQFFGISAGIEYLDSKEQLSFDKRKGEKAKHTKSVHREIEKRRKEEVTSFFALSDYICHVEPSSAASQLNMKVVCSGDDVRIAVRTDKTSKIQAVLNISVFDVARTISLHVTVYGEGEHGVQTMWNAVDQWVKSSSHYNSLMELYGHFTEPHPIFQVDSLELRCDLPVYRFAEHCCSFSNCSVLFPKSHLLEMWGPSFGESSFVQLARKLRGYRFDVRCHETNVAIPQGVYMVAYPFALPYDKQMNFFVREE